MNKTNFAILLVVSMFAISIFLSNQGWLLKRKFSIIDVHEHLLNRSEIPQIINVMNSLKISKMVLLNSLSDSSVNEENMDDLLRIKEEYPDRFLVFYTLDPNLPDSLEMLNERISQGIDGLKFYHGVIWEKTNEENLSKTLDFWEGKYNITSLYGPINSSQMKEVFKIAGKARLPVIIHVESSTYQLDEFEDVLKEFPNIKFICAHFCTVERNLQVLGNLFDRYPNLYTDISAWQRVGTFATKDTKSFREFILRYQDRIMWGSDIVIGSQDEKQIFNFLKCHLDLLEIKKFYCFLEPSTLLDGLNLPEETLRKIYEENPNKFFS